MNTTDTGRSAMGGTALLNGLGNGVGGWMAWPACNLC